MWVTIYGSLAPSSNEEGGEREREREVAETLPWPTDMAKQEGKEEEKQEQQRPWPKRNPDATEMAKIT